MNIAFSMLSLFMLLGNSIGFTETTAQEAIQKKHRKLELGTPKIVRDFEGKKEKAKEWAEVYFGKWVDELIESERKEISDYVNDVKLANEMNAKLEATRGKIPDHSELKKSIEEVDKALKKEKTNEPMYVYFRVQESFFGLEDGSLRSGAKINLENFLEFEKDFVKNQSILKENGYINVSLHGESPSLLKEPSLYIQLKVPEGVHAGYTGKFITKEVTNDFLIERGQGIQIKKASIINQKGREFIKLEAELIKDGTLKNELEIHNKELNNELGLSDKFAGLVNMDLTGRWITLNYMKTENIVQSIRNIEKNILLELQKQAFKYSPEPNLIIADYKPTDHEAFEHLKGDPQYDNAFGLHLDNMGHATIVSLDNTEEKLGKGEENHVTLHELGHAIDDLVFKKISNELNFKQIYNTEKDFFPDDNGYFSHVKSSSDEFFAECFAYYYSLYTERGELLKKYAPQAYTFIKNLKTNIIN
ncbi:hypothetical protein M3644_24420 [Bacillus cereus]|uniref:ADP-ribosyltransferase n=1 Tax=Bacillus cereus TaxID=1396 RepID=UPI00203EED08|nr:ADP-ribosyltransferase [Bacillus cereus]MCM3222912.1 hypothetical protein [Bacillus cereus]MEC3336041.1 ADP-ribosyltransferase [Bacillus cereus]